MEDQLTFTATDDVRGAIAAAGRTEDVTFSLDNRRLAIAAFNAGKCLLIDVEMDFSAGRKSIVLSDAVEITSPSLREPHGLAFLDSETLIVADRAGTVLAFKIPPSGSGQRNVTLPAQRTDDDAGFLGVNTPGSVVVIPVGRDGYDILVCNNYVHQVTRHRLVGRERLRVKKNEVLLKNGLNIPDGVAISPSERWVAISNHNTNSVLIFRNTRSLNQRSRAVGVLRDAGYPHGVRFTPDGQFVLVADAGGPVVRVYSGTGDDWRGQRDHATSFQVMSTETYLRGRANPQEGGPKGIDIDRGMNVLVVTSEHLPLAFFDLPAVLNNDRAAASGCLP